MMMEKNRKNNQITTSEKICTIQFVFNEFQLFERLLLIIYIYISHVFDVCSLGTTYCL